jgi:predicted enzyme related to lactoylglutathione lyase
MLASGEEQAMKKFGHMELTTRDPAAARTFYGALFGWTFTDVPMGETTYTMIDGLGGIAKAPMPEAPTQWVGYITVDSIDEATKQVRELGGQVHVDRTDAGGMGFFAIVSDPTGGTVGLWEETPARKAALEAEAKAATKKTKKAGKKAGKKAEKKQVKAARAAKKKEKKAEKKEKKAGKKKKAKK